MPPPDDRRTEDRPLRAAGSRGAAAPAEPATQRRALAALFLALMSLVGLLSLNYLQRGIYLAAYALLAGLLGMWLAVTSITRARRSRTALPRASVAAAVIAGAGIILSAIMLIAFATFGKQLNAYGQCLSTASTTADQQACQNQLIHAVNHEIAVVNGSRSG
jgi:hypothetical protein